MSDEYEEMSENEKSAYRKELFAELKAMGLLERNGKFRRSPITGEMRPVYVSTELGRKLKGVLPDDEIFAELEALGLIRRAGDGGKLKPRYVLTELGRRVDPILLDSDTVLRNPPPTAR